MQHQSRCEPGQGDITDSACDAEPLASASCAGPGIYSPCCNIGPGSIGKARLLLSLARCLPRVPGPFPWPQRAFLRRSVTQDSATSFGSAQALVSESCCRKTHASAPETRLAGRCGTRVDSVCVLRTPSEAPGACAAPMRRCKATAGAGCCLALRHAARRIASSTAPPGCRCRSPDPACASRHWPFRLRLTEARRAGRPHGDGCRQRR